MLLMWRTFSSCSITCNRMLWLKLWNIFVIQTKATNNTKLELEYVAGFFLFLFNFFFCMRADWTHTHTANCCNKRWLLLVLRQLCNAPRGGKVAESTIATATTTTTTQDTQITATTTNVSVAVFAQLFRYDCSIFVNVFFTLFFSVIRITQW